jgi:hypothetical protein
VTEFCSWDDSFRDVEALVRAAGQYVGASEDLRPRVLEAARLQNGEQRAQHCLRQVGMFVVLVALFTAEFRQELVDQRSSLSGHLSAVGYEEAGPAVSAAPRSGDGDWRVIDAFTKLRRQQAQLLRLEI